MNPIAKLKEVCVVGFAVLDRLVDVVQGLLGTTVRKGLSVVGQKILRSIAPSKCLKMVCEY